MILHRTPLVALLALPNSDLREEKINSGLSCKNRLMYPVVNGISGSLSCIPFFKAQDSGFNKQNWYPGFQNSYSSTWGDKRSHRAQLQMAYCDEKKQNGWKSTKTQPTDVTLFVGMAFAQVSHWRRGWIGELIGGFWTYFCSDFGLRAKMEGRIWLINHNGSADLYNPIHPPHWMFLTFETACPLPLSRPQASRPITMPTCIFNRKRDLFVSTRKHSAFFAAATVAQCFKKKFCTV